MEKKHSILLLLFFAAMEIYAQNVNALLEKGDKLFDKKDFREALDVYKQAVNMDPQSPEANFRLGMTFLHTEQKTKALPFLEKAYEAKPSVDEDFDFHLGMAYQYDHQYGKAKQHYEEFRRKNKRLAEIATHKIYECVIGDSLVQHPAHVVVDNLGPGINSPFHEIGPLIANQGKTLIFSSSRSTDAYKIKSGTNYEDIYIVHQEGTGWGTPQKISPKINSKYADAGASISHDGKTLFIYYDDNAGDIFYSTLENDAWTDPIPLNQNINTPLFHESSACMSADGTRLFFTSNRPGGKGELDIFVSERDAKGNWGRATNLGSTINTSGNEDSPFIHPDGVTLYFSSDGHASMGSHDIFKSEFKDGKWTKPLNLGYPINSIEYDGFFSISDDKKMGYFSSIREDGQGDADLFRVRFVDPPKPVEKVVVVASAEPKKTVDNHRKVEEFIDPTIQQQRDKRVVTVLKGKVIDETTAKPLGAVVSLVDNNTHRVLTKINADLITGDFELVIPHGGNYGVATERTGYLFNSINFNVPSFADYQEIDMHIIMVKAEVGSKVVLKNIFFDVGRSDLKKESIAELEKIRELLETNSQLKVQINGHTDNTGNAATNKVLSLNRAESVVQYLIEKGIDASRLKAKGFGAEHPLVSNDDEEEGRELNRRTEIEILEVSTQG